MDSPKVFISFSSRDKEFVRKLFYSLKSQNIDVWDYSQKGDEIPLGHSLPLYLEEQISTSDYFIPIISKNGMAMETGYFTRLEVRSAIQYGLLEKKKILPIVIHFETPETWEDIYNDIKDLVHLEYDANNPKQYEEIITRICRFMEVSYFPPFPGDLRLPFSDKFQNELKEFKGIPIAQYEELMLIINDFTVKFSESNWLSAYELISYFIMASNYKVPEKQIYYPHIVKGVCEIHLGRFIEAEETFKEAAKHPNADENSFSGLGQIYFRQRRYEEAFVNFQKALDICSSEFQLEIIVNIISTLIEKGESVENIDLLDKFDLSKMSADEKTNILNMKGIFYYKKRDFNNALKVFENMYKNNLGDIPTITYYFLTLKEIGRYNEALTLLKTEAEKTNNTNLYHHLADFYLQTGKVIQCLDIYINVLCKPDKRTRQYMVEYARILKYNGNKDRTRDICGMVLDHKYFNYPKTKEDFYYDGFANFLLGKDERARYDFERSTGFFNKYYDELKI
jgi:tetratricopeptide (TPR) repeat protein